MARDGAPDRSGGGRGECGESAGASRAVAGAGSGPNAGAPVKRRAPIRLPQPSVLPSVYSAMPPPERIPPRVFAGHEALARAVAARIAEVIRDRRAAGARPVLGLAT